MCILLAYLYGTLQVNTSTKYTDPQNRLTDTCEMRVPSTPRSRLSAPEYRRGST